MKRIIIALLAITLVSFNGHASYMPNAGDWIDLRDMLPPNQPDGATNNSSAVNAGVAALCAASTPSFPGGKILMPPGHYVLKDIAVHCGGIIFDGSGASNNEAGTIWDYTGASNFGLQFEPTGWPAVTTPNLLFGNAVQNIAFYHTGSDQTRALDFVGFDSAQVSHIQLNGTLYNGIRFYGGYKAQILDVTSEVKSGLGTGVSNYALEIRGDLSGENSSGGSCTLDCSSRVDVVRIQSFDVQGSTGSTGVYIHGLADTTTGENITIEGGFRGLDIECDAGFPDITYCPQFTQFTDFESEGFSNEGARLFDQSDFQCFGCYFIGASGGGSGSVIHAVESGFTNYTQTLGTGGGVRLYGGRYGNSSGSAVYLNTSDNKIIGSVIIDANLSNIGAAGVEIAAGDQHLIQGNTFCNYLATSSPAMTGVLLDNNMTDPVSAYIITENTFYHCSAGITDNAAGTSVKTNNLGP